MKYFTKEWIEMLQHTHFHLSLIEDKRAENFSEAYFNELYNESLKESAALLRDASDLLATEKPCMDVVPYNKEKYLAVFAQDFERQIQQFEECIPDYILNQIADIRVFVLKHATKEVISAIAKHCEEMKNVAHNMGCNYCNEFKEIFSDTEKKKVQKIAFHDCEITEVENHDNILTIHFDHEDGFSGIDAVKLFNINIIEKEVDLRGAIWLYEEIYKCDWGYELHVLLLNGGEKYFTVQFEDMAFFDKGKEIV